VPERLFRIFAQTGHQLPNSSAVRERQ
jgi:hypothetical protein